MWYERLFKKGPKYVSDDHTIPGGLYFRTYYFYLFNRTVENNLEGEYDLDYITRFMFEFLWDKEGPVLDNLINFFISISYFGRNIHVNVGPLSMSITLWGTEIIEDGK